MTTVVLPLGVVLLYLAMFTVTVIAVRLALTARARLHLTQAALLDTHARLLQTRAILAEAQAALQATDTCLANLDKDLGGDGAAARRACGLAVPPKVH